MLRNDSATGLFAQSTLRQQYDMLTAAGYDVQLWAGPDCEDWVEVDIGTIDMTMNSAEAEYTLTEERGEGWQYHWRSRKTPTGTPETQAMDAATV